MRIINQVAEEVLFVIVLSSVLCLEPLIVGTHGINIEKESTVRAFSDLSSERFRQLRGRNGNLAGVIGRVL